MEYAATDMRGGDGRPNRRFIEGMKDLHDALQRSPTACETCEHGIASTPKQLGGRFVVVCRTCEASWRKWTPIEKRERMTSIARQS